MSDNKETKQAPAVEAASVEHGQMGWKLAMRVMQSDLFEQLDDAERAECDALVRANPYMNFRSNADSAPAPAVDAGAQDEREDFEAAMEKHGRMRPFTRWPSDDSYTDDRIEWARRGWLAALARASEAAAGEPVPTGWKLVPVKSTPEMQQAFKDAYKGGSIWTDRIDYALEQFIDAAPQPASETREAFALKALVAAGHIAQEKVDRALTIAAKFNAHLPANEPVEEGCTPADAKMLRAANHSLAAENDRLRRRLRPFADLANPRLSWAMVEYCIDGDPEKQTLQAPQMQRAFNRAAEALADELPSHVTVDCDALDLPDWIKNAKPPAPEQPASEQQPVPQVFADKWDPAREAFGKTVFAGMSNSDDLWPVWLDGWLRASEQQAASGLSDDVRSRLEFYAACYCKSTSVTDREAGKAMYALLAAKGDGHA